LINSQLIEASAQKSRLNSSRVVAAGQRNYQTLNSSLIGGVRSGDKKEEEI